MIFENHNVIAHVVFCFRLSTCQKTDTCNIVGWLVGWLVGWFVGCFRFDGPLRQYFSLYRAVSQREGERGEKG